MIPLNKQMGQNMAEINDFMNNYNLGKAKETSVANSYVRLFTLDMSSIY